MTFNKLFSPIKIRDLELRNRVVMAAMGTHESAASEDGKSVTDKLIAYHVARAKGGCGLNTVEVTAVDKASSPHGFLSIAEDKYIEGLKKLNDAVHAVGGKTAVQLWQGGLAVASDPTVEILLPNDAPLAPNYVVKAITNERLLSVIEAFGQAARRAVEAGLSGTCLPHRPHPCICFLKSLRETACQQFHQRSLRRSENRQFPGIWYDRD